MPDKSRVEQLLATDWVREPTRRALQTRLDTPVKTEPEYFSAVAFRQLQFICARLIPQPQQEVDLPGSLDTQLKHGSGKGWRYDMLPPDEQLFETGIQAVNATAIHLYQQEFGNLDEYQQDELLERVQRGEVNTADWQNLNAAAFFTELLASLVSIFYSHPAGRDECGDRSFADAHGWSDLGLNAASDLPDYTLDKG